MRISSNDHQAGGVSSRNGNPARRALAANPITANIIKAIKNAIKGPAPTAAGVNPTKAASAAKVRIMITKTKANASGDAGAVPGVDRANTADRMSAGVPASNTGARSMGTRMPDGNNGSGSNGAASNSAGNPIMDTKKPTISAVLTVRLAIVPVLKSDTKAGNTAAASKAASGGPDRSNPRTTTPKKAIALLPIAVVLTIKKTSSMMKTMTRITVALRQDMASRAAVAGRAPIEIGELLLARIN